MGGKIINIGFGNIVVRDRIVSVIQPSSHPIKRLRDEAYERNKLIDATMGKKTRSVIITDTDHIILSAISVETILQRIEGK